MSETMTHENTSKQLAERASDGDRAAFDQLAAIYRGRVLQTVRRQERERGRVGIEPEDIVSEAFLRALRSVDKFEWTGEESFLRWVLGIARNVRREEARRRKSVLSLERAESAAAAGPSPSRILAREERLERFEKAMRGLPEHYREVLRLVRIEGLKIHEAAERVGKSPDAVKHLLARALRSLREKLDDTGSLHLPDRRLDEDR